MIPRSTIIALAAMVLSLVVHFLGVSLTTTVQEPLNQPDPAPDQVAVGQAFEDLAEAAPEPVVPQETPPAEPEPEPEPVPEPERAEVPTSEALVASSNPQNVAAPDVGSGEVVQPESTGAAELEIGSVPEPTTIEPSNGQETEVAVAPVAPPPGSDAVTELAQGVPDATTEPIEAAPAVTPPAQQQLAALPPESAPVLEPVPEPTIVPVVPLESEAGPDSSEQAVTSSLRPRLRTEKAASAQQGVSEGSPNETNDLRAPSQIIESPLAAYKRDGTNLFAGRSGGTRSGGIGFQNSSGPGNSDVTNYAGQVLVHLNRVTPVAVASKGWARVFFEINPDGTLAWVDIIDGVGSRDIDRAARAQVRNGVPFPKPPGGKSYKLVFVYQLR